MRKPEYIQETEVQKIPWGFFESPNPARRQYFVLIIKTKRNFYLVDQE